MMPTETNKSGNTKIDSNIAFTVIEKMCVLFMDYGIINRDSAIIAKIRVALVEMIESVASWLLS